MRRLLIVIPAVLLVLFLAVFVLDRTGTIDLNLGGDSASETADADSGESDRERGKDDDDEDGESEAVPVPVELALADERQISAYYRASSVVEADRQVNLVARMAGRVSRVNVEEGDWVKSGQVLAELENDRERVHLEQAKVREADAKREFERVQGLLERQLVTQDEFDDAKSARDLAVSDRELSRIALDDTMVRAPFAGQITTRHIVAGQSIGMTEPTFTLVDFEPLRVRIHLPEVIARKVGVRDEVLLDVEAASAPVPAIVERISPVVDPETSTIRLTLLVDGAPEEIRVGGFVKVRVTTDTQTEALAVPKVALVEDGGLRSVFLAEADSVRKVEIRTGLYDETHIEVLEGLEAGDLIVELGQGGLRTGSRIDVLNATEVGWVAPAAPSDEENAEGGDDADPADDESASVASLGEEGDA